MNKVIICLLLAATITSCKDQPYLHHKLEFEKVADNCSAVSQKFDMNSNINGERYEFNKCLSTNFSKENVTYARQGDTVIVRFETPKTNEKSATYHITLDVDTYPRYNFLTIDGDTFIIVPTNG